MSEPTDNRKLEDEDMTRVIEADTPDEQEERWIDSESEDDGWDDDEAIPARPRGRLLRPLPLALVAVTIGAAGFLGGVLAQQGSEGGTGAAAGPSAAGLASFAAAKGEGAASAEAPSLAGGASSAAASGTVTGVEGQTIYVKESDGTTVAVKAGDGSTVTRDSKVAAKKIHPGDTVVVEGSKRGSTVRAGSIAATESGVGAAATVESLFEK